MMTDKEKTELDNLIDIYLSSKQYMSRYEFLRMKELEQKKSLKKE